MKKTLLILFLLFITNQNVFAVPYFADTIIDHNSGTGLDYTGDEHLPRILGSSDLVFLSIGETGYVTVAFGGLFLVNGIGNDVRIYTTSHSISHEPADIAASKDGINFISLGMLDPFKPSVWVGNGPSYEIWYQEFDLYDAGLSYASFLKISDLPGGFVSTDIDAIAALNASAIPEPATMLLFGTGLVGFVLRRRKA